MKSLLGSVILDISLEDFPKPPWIRGIPFVSSLSGGDVSDLSQGDMSRSCQWPVEIVRRQRLMMLQKKGNIIPYVLMEKHFRFGIGILIFWASPFEICPIWLLIYMRNVRLDHCPIFIMVVSLFPCSFRDMPPPYRRKWTPTRLGLMPERQSLRVEAENRMAVIRSVDMTVAKGYLPVTLYLQIYYYVLPSLARMWCILRAKDLQRQRLEAKG